MTTDSIEKGESFVVSSQFFEGINKVFDEYLSNFPIPSSYDKPLEQKLLKGFQSFSQSHKIIIEENLINS